MHESRTEALVALDPAASIPGMLRERLERDADGVFAERLIDGTWTPVTVSEFVAEVTAVAKGLVACGVEPGDRVAIMSRTRYEWTVIDFACWAAGAIGVPVYETSSAEQVRWIAADAGVRLALVETAAHAAVVAQVRNDLPGLTGVLVIDEGAIQTLVENGADIADEEIARRSAIARADDLATVIYTSGTTGRPKGVELTHGNFVSLTLNGAAGLREVCAMPHSRTLLFMPLAHVFARFIQVLSVPGGAVLGHTPDAKNLIGDLAGFQPTFILAVPRVFEKVYNSAEQKAGSGAKLKLFRWAARAAEDYSRALDTGGPARRCAPGTPLPVGWSTRSSGRRWAAARSTRSPAAPRSGLRLGHFYRGIGVDVLEGYGLTETTAPTSVNRPGATKVGTVGTPMPGTALRVDDDGQVYVWGPHVFRGYRHDAEATAEALVDGWFRTGDLGHARRRRLPDDHRAHQGDHRDRRRQERRPGTARGPTAGPPAGEPGRGGR